MDDAWPRYARLALPQPGWPERLAFELWLGEQLLDQYGGPVEAPLPPDLRELLERD